MEEKEICREARAQRSPLPTQQLPLTLDLVAALHSWGPAGRSVAFRMQAQVPRRHSYIPRGPRPVIPSSSKQVSTHPFLSLLMKHIIKCFQINFKTTHHKNAKALILKACCLLMPQRYDVCLFRSSQSTRRAGRVF